MQAAIKLIITFLVFIASFYFIYYIPFALIPWINEIDFLPEIVSLLIAIGIAVFVWKKTTITMHSLASYIIMGGIIVGSIAFLIGFLGPIIFTPESNQGPLLGIFITGPLGFIVGLISGAIYWKIKQRKQAVKL